jgi:hypothetical protein
MIYYDHAASNLQRRAASSDPATGQRPPGPSRDTPGRYRAGDRQPGGDDRSSVRPRPPPADARPDGRRSFQLSMKAPVRPVSSRTEVNEPRRMASRVMIEKKHSTKFGEAFVGRRRGQRLRLTAGRQTGGRGRGRTTGGRGGGPMVLTELPCGCPKLCRLMRPGRIRGGGRRACRAGLTDPMTSSIVSNACLRRSSGIPAARRWLMCTLCTARVRWSAAGVRSRRSWERCPLGVSALAAGNV